VQVLLVGTQLGALTGPDGRFTIAGVPAGTFTVRAQRIGFSPQTREVAVAAGQSVTADFQLAGAATQLTAVSVVGYTNEQRRDISGAVTTVSGDELRDQVVATVEEALRGRAQGCRSRPADSPVARRRSSCADRTASAIRRRCTWSTGCTSGRRTRT
jgi:hypothetical protein